MSSVDHYADRYWNDLPQVLRYMQRRATGDPEMWWMDHLKQEWCTPPRRRATRSQAAPRRERGSDDALRDREEMLTCCAPTLASIL